MSAPIIAIVGSVDPTRTDYNPKLRQPEVAKQAAEALGQALARAGYRILVYSRDPSFVEADVVRGYVTSGKAPSKGVVVRYPMAIYSDSVLSFPEEATRGDVFAIDPDTNARWEVSFYRSLKEVDGVLLIGGAQAVLVTGILAQAYRIPLVTVAAFGGSAHTVWSLPVATLAEQEDRALMGSDVWKPTLAETLVQSFDRQRARLRKDERDQLEARGARRREWTSRARVAGIVMMLAAASAVFGAFGDISSNLLFGAVFVLTPSLAGAAGALARVLYDYVRGVIDEEPRPSVVSGALGMSAGIVSALLFALAQWATIPPKAVPGALSPLIPFELVIGFIAGLTLDAVFGRLRDTTVLNTAPVAQ